VGAARHHVRETLEARHIPEQTVDTVELLTSEIVTNAIVHGHSAPTVALVVSDQDVRVAVADDSSHYPELRRAGPETAGGRGIHLVDRLSSVWGSEPIAGGGKQVWFEVPFRYR
jgi:anti-sigma regulatory factor (Ser/Thr protein kinase)